MRCLLTEVAQYEQNWLTTDSYNTQPENSQLLIVRPTSFHHAIRALRDQATPVVVYGVSLLVRPVRLTLTADRQ